MDEVIKQLRTKYKEISDNLYEDNVRDHIIINTFMKAYGYTEYTLGEPVIKGFCDIFIPIDDKRAFIIEVKRGDKKITDDDIRQVQAYVAGKGQRFSLVTNGHEYVLIDSLITPLPTLIGNSVNSYTVFRFDIFMARGRGVNELKYFKYLSYEYLYVKQLTDFFSDIAQYKVWKREQKREEQSIANYVSTLNRFFDYYANKLLAQKEFNAFDSSLYESININIFDGFIRSISKKSDIPIDTLRNKHSHLYNMLCELKRHKKIWFISLSESRKESLSRYEETELRKPYEELNERDIDTILNFLKLSKTPVRDTVIFLLTITLGLERSQLLQLKWSDFDKSFKHLFVDGRKIILPERLKNNLTELNQIAEKEKIKSPFVFQKNKKNKYKPVDVWNINDVFNSFTKISKDKKWELYSPQYARNGLILSLYSANYSIEDIMYITGIDINNISNYISRDDMLNRRSKEINWKSLYGGLLCDTSKI